MAWVGKASDQDYLVFLTATAMLQNHQFLHSLNEEVKPFLSNSSAQFKLTNPSSVKHNIIELSMCCGVEACILYVKYFYALDSSTERSWKLLKKLSTLSAQW
jgi:hypothetical protein